MVKRTCKEVKKLTEWNEDSREEVERLRRQLDSLNQCQTESGKAIDVLTKDGQYLGEQMAAAETCMVSIEGDVEHLKGKTSRHNKAIGDLIGDMQTLQLHVQGCASESQRLEDAASVQATVLHLQEQVYQGTRELGYLSDRLKAVEWVEFA